MDGSYKDEMIVISSCPFILKHLLGLLSLKNEIHSLINIFSLLDT